MKGARSVVVNGLEDFGVFYLIVATAFKSLFTLVGSNAMAVVLYGNLAVAVINFTLKVIQFVKLLLGFYHGFLCRKLLTGL